MAAGSAASPPRRSASPPSRSSEPQTTCRSFRWRARYRSGPAAAARAGSWSAAWRSAVGEPAATDAAGGTPPWALARSRDSGGLGGRLHDVVACGAVPAVLVGAVTDHGRPTAEVVERRRRRGRPFEGGRLPRIV